MAKFFKKYQFLFCFSLTLVFVLIWPVLLFAQSGLVVCGTGSGATPTDCNFDKLKEQIDKVINFIFSDVIVPIGTIVIIYAGGRLVYFSSFKSNPGEANKAKTILWNVVLGMMLALGAYAIVKSILQLVPEGESGIITQVIEQVFR